MSEIDMDAMAEEFELLTPAEKNARLEAAKEALKEVSARLVLETNQRRALDIQVKQINDAINKSIEEIRHIWMPFIQGSTEATLKLDNGLDLQMKETLTVSVEDKQAAIAWFEANGYRDVMKWDIHHQTMSAIARERYKDINAPIEIPGLKYISFPIIKVK